MMGSDPNEPYGGTTLLSSWSYDPATTSNTLVTSTNNVILVSGIIFIDADCSHTGLVTENSRAATIILTTGTNCLLLVVPPSPRSRS